MTTSIDADEILRRIGEAATPADALASGLLFHGTCEAFDLPPRGGGYDGLVWTATAPTVAQTYIPVAGSQSMLSAPDRFRLGERVRPDPNSTWTTVARQMGFAPNDVEMDDVGRLLSWSVPNGWPTYGEAAAFVAGLGYDLVDSPWVSIDRRDGVECVLRADWRLPGRLLVTVADGLDLADLRRGSEGDLGDLEYHDHGLFAAARRAGKDGVTINDFAQTRRWGNVGHVSHGIFPEVAARLPWIEVPASRFEWTDSLAVTTTPEFEAFHEELSRSPSPGFG
jgi:hypothetical protein